MDLWDSTGAKEAEPHVILGKVLNRLGEFGVRYPSIYEGIGSVCLQLIQLWDGCVKFSVFSGVLTSPFWRARPAEPKLGAKA